MSEGPSVVLASSSPARARLLAAAGVEFVTDPARVDEDAIRDGLAGEGARPHEVADALAEIKATRISARHGPALVVGADQILYCDGRIFAKPSSLTAAREQVLALRGRTHLLYTAVVVARQGEPIWRHYTVPKMTMRRFSDAVLDWHAQAAGEAVTQSVGGYHLEGPGIQLFDRVDGDYFSVLGLPLLPLLGFLRQHGAVPS